MKHVSIAIDGPSGVGKSTIAKSLAGKLGFVYIDTGAMYRALGVYFLGLGIDPEDEAEVSASLGDVSVGISYGPDGQHVLVNGEDVTPKLRTEEISRAASVTSRYPAVRTKLLELQRELAAKENVIMDGRDIGTVVLPDANLKLFLTASSAVRAERRYRQLLGQGLLGGLTLEEIRTEIEERDFRDMNRKTAPLRKAEGAVEIDTSLLTAEEVEKAVLAAISEATGGSYGG